MTTHLRIKTNFTKICSNSFLFLFGIGCLSKLSSIADACQGCKTSMESTTAAANAGVGYAASIYFMLAMPILITGFIAFAGYKNLKRQKSTKSKSASAANSFPPQFVNKLSALPTSSPFLS